MRKNGIMTLLVMALLLLTACRYEGKVKVYENTEQNEVSHEEESRTFVILRITYLLFLSVYRERNTGWHITVASMYITFMENLSM